MIHPPPTPARQRPMAVKVAVATPRRPAFQLRWSWLLLALLTLLVAAAVAGALLLVR